jgi:hypothetical protein
MAGRTLFDGLSQTGGWELDGSTDVSSGVAAAIACVTHRRAGSEARR